MSGMTSAASIATDRSHKRKSPGRRARVFRPDAVFYLGDRPSVAMAGVTRREWGTIAVAGTGGAGHAAAECQQRDDKKPNFDMFHRRIEIESTRARDT